MKPNKWQQEVLSYREGNLVVQSLPGTGKTTVAVEYAKQFDNLKICMVAFNKHIASEIAKKVPPNVDVRTCHSLGLQIVRRNSDEKLQIDGAGRKLNDATFNTLREHDLIEVGDRNDNLKLTKKLVNLCRVYLIDNPSPKDVTEIIEHYRMEFERENVIIDLIPQIYKRLNVDSRVDFVDMLTFPHFYNLENREYDLIVGDEIQDLNKGMLDVIKRSLKPAGRFVGFGDKYQAINGFAGASPSSFNDVKNYFQANELLMPQTYRCPRLHVEIAKKLVPSMCVPQTAIDGEVEQIDIDQAVDMLQPSDLVICRLNAPLIEIFYKALAIGKAFYIKGRNFHIGLMKQIKDIEKQFKPSDIEEFISATYSARLAVMDQYESKERDTTIVEDRFNAILSVAKKCDTIPEILETFSVLFKDKFNAIYGSSVHRAKGAEAERVFILDGKKMPLKYKNQKEWQEEQELNTLFVSLTRSKRELYFINNVPSMVKL